MNYRIVEDKKLISLHTSHLSKCPVLSVDIETNNQLSPQKGVIRLLQMSEGTKAVLFDFKEMFPEYWNNAKIGGKDIRNEPEILELKALLENSEIMKVLHNAKFDMKWLEFHLGIKLNPVFDTMIASQLLSYESRHNLVSVAKKYLGVNLDKTEQNTDWTSPLTEAKAEYGALDVLYLVKLRELMKQELIDAQLTKAAKIDFNCLQPCVSMELAGVKVNKPLYVEKIKKIKELRIIAHDKLQQYLSSGEKIVQQSLFGGVEEKTTEATLLTSHEQVGKRLRELGVDIVNRQHPEVIKRYAKIRTPNSSKNKEIVKEEWEKSIEYVAKNLTAMDVPFALGTGDKALKAISGEHEALVPLKEFREADKLESSYGDSFLEHIVQAGDHHRVFADYKINGAATYRMSAARPNIQQITNKPITIDKVEHEIGIREAFDFRVGYKGLNYDLGGIELRVLADLSGDPVMLEIFNNNKDMHSMTGAGIMKLSYDEFIKVYKDSTSDRHDEAYKARSVVGKRTNFGVVYGIGAPGLSGQLLCTKDEGQNYINDWATTYKVAWDYLTRNANSALSNLQIRNKTGRRQIFKTPYIKAKKEVGELSALEQKAYQSWVRKQEGGIKRNGKNFPIQSLAADIMKVGWRLTWERIQDFDAKIVSIIHDELNLEVQEDQAEEVGKIVENSMREAGEMFISRIPVVVEGGIVSSWAQK